MDLLSALAIVGATVAVVLLSAGLTLWISHVGRTGVHPLPRVPRILTLGRATHNGEAVEVPERPARRVGP